MIRPLSYADLHNLKETENIGGQSPSFLSVDRGVLMRHYQLRRYRGLVGPWAGLLKGLEVGGGGVPRPDFYLFSLRV